MLVKKKTLFVVDKVCYQLENRNTGKTLFTDTGAYRRVKQFDIE